MALLPGTLTIPDRREHARHRLLMFHHACGSATNYFRWAAAFAPHIEVWLVELPGRGRSLRHGAFDALPPLRDYLRELAPNSPPIIRSSAIAWARSSRTASRKT